MKTSWLWAIPFALAACACTTPESGAERGAAWGEGAENRQLSVDTEGRTICQGVVCDPSASCSGTGTDAHCACLDGYEGDGVTCTDIDECADAALNDCAVNACINNAGSFRCECPPGSVGDGKQCTDVDECEGAANTCDPNASCVNTATGFGCECNAGFSGDGFGCADTNECADELYTCAENGLCENTFGSYDCRCAPGFSGDGKSSCVALCDLAHADPSVCHEQGLCRIDGRVAICDACAPGMTGDGKVCTAASCSAECDGAGTDDLPHAICTSDGSCSCAPGFTGPVGACADVDECSADSGGCGDNAVCINLAGGHVCDCLPGFVADATGACVDKDECAQDPPPCHPDATCTNVPVTENPAGYECACKPGFSGDGTICADIDECAVSNGGCTGNATCLNLRGSSACECQAPLVGTAGACHCDLTGLWAMRHDVDTCWGARQLIEGNTQNLISSGYMEASVWELQEIVYDGEQFELRAKGCGTDNTPDFVSPLFRETYSAYIPDATYDALEMLSAPPFSQPGIVPGAAFTTPSMAAVLGIDLGPDPLNAPWPGSHLSVSDLQWVDADQDGEPGMTLWSRVPSQTADSGARNYSYVPAKPAINGSDLTIAERAGCLSVAARVISHLEVTVNDCTRMTGRIINEKTEGRVRSCAYVAKGTCDPMNPNSCSGWDQDIACTPEYWSSAGRCDTEDLDRLDDDQNQAVNSKATFELVRLGDIGQTFTCDDVRNTLPALVRTVPTITCTTPQ